MHSEEIFPIPEEPIVEESLDILARIIARDIFSRKKEFIEKRRIKNGENDEVQDK